MSKNRYSAIKKIRKEELRKIEKRLMALEAKSHILQEKIDEAIDVLLKSAFPTEGELGLLQSGADLKALKRVEINTLKEELLQLRQELENEQKAYKKANIEYEKIAYLYEELEKERKVEMVKEEVKMLDEIAVMLHNKAKENG